MHRIIREKSSGKTRELLELAREQGAIVICSNPQAMKEKALAYGITGVQYASYIEACNYYFSVDTPILIDELDEFLKVFDKNVVGYSISEDK